MLDLNIELIILVYFSLSLLSLITFIILVHNYIKDKKKDYSIHSLTKILMSLTFFISLSGIYNFIIHLSQYGLITPEIYYRLAETNISVLPNFGILISTILVVHFMMGKKIEEFKKKEDLLSELQKLNHELEKKAFELENSQDSLMKKVVDLEKHNEIARQRETKMIELIRKIEDLENKAVKKKKK